MAKYLSNKVKEYFKRDNAASVWWNVDNLPRYKSQPEWMLNNFDFKDKDVLDLGTGKGRFSITAALNGSKQVTAVDISKQMLKEAYKKFLKFKVAEKIELIESDIESFSIDKQYDVIILMEVLVHLPNPRLVLSNCYQMLKKGGVIFTNIDLPITEYAFYQGFQEMIRRGYNILPMFVRKQFNSKMGWPCYVEKKIIYETTEETLLEMELDPQKTISRAKDAFRTISYEELSNYLNESGFKIEKSKKEYYLGIKIGYLVIASKQKDYVSVDRKEF